MASWPYNTKAWARLRLRQLAKEPLCRMCAARGDVTPATEVDHIVAIKRGGDAFPGLDGLQSLCRSCHSRKTAAIDCDNSQGYFSDIGADGWPLDPSHPLNREGR